MSAQESPRFLITRLSAIGDCITAVPLACAIRDAYPSAFVAWAVGAPAESLLRDHPCVNQFLVIPKRWLKSPLSHLSTRRTLHRLRFDYALDPQSLTKSAMLAWHSGAKERLGFAKPQGREFSTMLNNRLITPQSTHVVDQQLELLKPLGIEPRRVRFDIPVGDGISQQTKDQVQTLVGKNGFQVLNPGAGWDSRLWPTSRFAEVARQAGTKLGMPSLVIWAGEREKKWAREIVAHSGEHAHLAPPTDLKSLAALLSLARLYVGSDTGPTHLAAAMGTPCVCMCGTTRGEVSGPYGSFHVIVQAYYHAGTSRERRSAGNDAMLAISVDDVFSACRKILGRPSANVA